MADFPESALHVATYFEDTYIGKRLPITVEGSHPFLSEYGTCMKGYVNNYHELIMLLRGDQGRRERERAPGHNFGCEPPLIF